MTASGWALLIGGFAFFFLGLASSRDGIQLIAGERLRLLMSKLPHSHFFAVAIDALVAMSLMSSRAAILIAVNFAENQLIPLSHAFLVILGADIGTALVIIFLSVHDLTAYALYIAAAGIMLEKFARSQRMRRIGSIVMGLGLVLFGMYLLYGAAARMDGNSIVSFAAPLLSSHPLSLLVLSIIFTMITRTTAGTIALAIAVSFSGVFTLESAIPIVLGANVGSSIMCALACMRRGGAGKRVALFHVLVKVIGVAIVFPFIPDIAALAGSLDAYLAATLSLNALDTGVKIALTHLLFNVAIAVAFVPLIGPAVALAKRFVPESKESLTKFGPKHLDDEAIETPAIAFAAAKREVMRIAKIAREMFAGVLGTFRMDVDFEAMAEMAAEADDKIDMLEKSVRFYLAKISQKSLTEEQAADELALITIAGAIEDIGDTVQRDLVGLARKKRRKLARFSEEGYAELSNLHKLVLENFDLMIGMLVRPHEEITKKMMRHEGKLNDMEQELRQSHLMRLHQGLPESFDTSTIHLDILNHFRLINFKLAKIVQSAAELV